MKSRNEGKPKICRITSLKGFQGALLGRDFGEIFKEGHVFEAQNIMGEIVIRDLGPHACPKWLKDKDGALTGTLTHYATNGVVMLTEKEFEAEQLAREKNEL